MARMKFTARRIGAIKCPPGKVQAFLWDADQPGLGLRVTPSGKPSYIFQSEYQGRTLRMTIGGPQDWSIPKAQEKARELQRQIDEGRDPREVKAAAIAADVAKRTAELGEVLTVAEVWPRYMAEGKPKRRATWKPHYVSDLKKAASLGGEPKRRGKGTTKPGHLAAPIQAARAVTMFSGFLGWCSTKKDLCPLVNKEAARASALGDVLPGVNKRRDALEIAQLPAWFAGTDKPRSRVAAAYLQALVLTGARRDELAGLRWTDVDFQWHKLTLADKVESTRAIPLTPCLAWLLGGLPRHNA